MPSKSNSNSAHLAIDPVAHPVLPTLPDVGRVKRQLFTPEDIDSLAAQDARELVALFDLVGKGAHVHRRAVVELRDARHATRQRRAEW